MATDTSAGLGGEPEPERSKNRGCCTAAFFLWVIPTVRKGYSTPIQETDVPPLTSRLSTDMVPGAEALWAAEVAKGKDKASILSVVWQLDRFGILMAMTMSCSLGVLSCVVRPLLLRAIVLEISQPVFVPERAAFLLVIFFFAVFFEGFFQATVKQVFGTSLCTRGMAWLSTLVVQKSCRIRPGVTTISDSALVGTDLVTAFQETQMACLAFMIFTGVIGGVIVLVTVLGPSSLIGLGFLVCVLAGNMKLATISRGYTGKLLKATDKRLGVTKEIINGIKPLKMQGWESQMHEQVTNARMVETFFLRLFRLFMIANMALGRSSPIVASCLTFVYMTSTGANLTVANVLAALTCFQSLRLPLIMIPLQITILGNLMERFGRVRTFLLLPEKDVRPLLPELSANAVEIKDATFKWRVAADETSTASTAAGASGAASGSTAAAEEPVTNQRDEFIMSNVTLDVPRGGMVAVVGGVGQGKTSLLLAILNELNVTCGSIRSIKSVGYVAQKPWVMSGTFEENILMGSPKDDERLDAVIKSANLSKDLLQLDDGLQQEIGERGSTLSGGQQQRLAMARALYSSPDLLLLDDPLAAVDTSVCKAIFNEGIIPYVKGQGNGKRACVMALNQLALLPQFDYIVFLQDGKVAEAGTFDELFAAGNAFADLVKEFRDEEAVAVDDVDTGDKSEDAEKPAEQQAVAVVAASKAGAPLSNGTAAKDANVLVKEEHGAKGKHDSSVLFSFLRDFGWGGCYFGMVVVFFMVTMSLFACQDLWLLSWLAKITTQSASERAESMTIYIGLAFGFCIMLISASVLNAFGSVAALRAIHGSVITRLFKAPISWWESTPSGRILSRFSGDLALVDQMLGFMIDDVLHFSFMVIALCVVVCVVVPPTLAVIIVGVPLYGWVVLAVDTTNRESKRMANMALGPVLTNLSEQVQGRLVVETQSKHEFFRQRHMALIDKFNRQNFFSLSLISTTQMVSSLISSCISATAGGIVLFNPSEYDPAFAGLAIMYSFLIPYFLGFFAMILSMFFAAFTSLQRFAEYRSEEVPQEAAWFVGDEKTADPAVSWPQSGSLVFDKVTLIYREGLSPAVKQVSFSIEDGTKVGVVGRTGAGKSSLAVLLFRINEAAEGTITLDGRNIANVGLQTLRQACAIIPQDPLLLNGTVRRNLDPFNIFAHKGDAFLRQCLQKVGLDQNLLDTELGGGSSGLSAGEKQLLSLARVLLRHDTIRLVVMDEPTANIDMATDEKVQACIQREFASKTVITIAHRVNTVIDNKIIVMEQGTVAEFDSSHRLLQNPESHLSVLVDAMGPAAAANLRQRAEYAHQSGRNSRHLSLDAGDSTVIESDDVSISI